jgi:cytochrome c oxidase subunit 2
VTEVSEYIHWFHDWLNVIIFIITLFVLGLLIYVAWRFNEKATRFPRRRRITRCSKSPGP